MEVRRRDPEPRFSRAGGCYPSGQKETAMHWVLFSLANVILRPFGVSLYVKRDCVHRGQLDGWNTVELFGKRSIGLMRHVSISSDGGTRV